MKKTVKWISLITLICLTASIKVPAYANVDGVNFYVATNGDDSNSGTIDFPFATVEKARDAIRELKVESGLPNGGVTVYIRGGTYQLTESLEFTEEDSGTEAAPIVYQEYPGEHAVLSGGVSIPGKSFIRVTDQKVLERFYPEVRNKIVYVNLKDYGFTDFGTWVSGDKTYQPWELAGETDRNSVPGLMLFVDDVPLDIARVPNRIYSGKDEGMWDYFSSGKQISSSTNGKGQTFVYTDDRIEKWKTYKDVAVYGFWNTSWKIESSAIHYVDFEKKQITLRHKLSSGTAEGRRYIYLNVLEELDNENEYYVDKDSGILYMYARDGLTKTNVDITQFGRDASKDFLVSFDHASYITLRNLDITLSRTTGVHIKGGRNVLIDGCEIKNHGRTAVSIGGFAYDSKNPARGTRAVYNTEYMGYSGGGFIDRNDWENEWAAYNHGVVNSRLLNTGSYGAILMGGDYLEAEKANHFIYNCEIANTGRYDSALSWAVNVVGVGLTVSHSSIHHNSSGAFNFGGADIIMEYNDIYHNCIDNSDYGVFYSCGWYNEHNLNTEIRYNYIHDVPNTDFPGDALTAGRSQIATRHGVYNDNCQPFLEVHHNLFYDIPSGIYEASGAENNWFDNVFVDVLRPMTIAGNDGVAGSLNSKKTPFSYVGYATFTLPELIYNEKFNSAYPQWARVRQELLDRGSAAWKPSQKVTGNVSVFYNTLEYYTSNIIKQSIYVPGTIDDEYCTIDNNYVTSSDIGFRDIEKADFRFREDAKIFDINPEIEKIDVSIMGYGKSNYAETMKNSVILKIGKEKAYVFGNENLIDKDNPHLMPVIENSRTLVPVRFIAESFGAEVLYDNNEIIVRYNDMEIKMRIGETAFSVSGEELEMDAAPEIIGDRTFIPLRALSEALSKNVYWDNRGLIVISELNNMETDKNDIDKILSWNF